MIAKSVADVMETRGGWKIERQTNPACMHFTVMPWHAECADKLLGDMQVLLEGSWMICRDCWRGPGGTGGYAGTAGEVCFEM